MSKYFLQPIKPLPTKTVNTPVTDIKTDISDEELLASTLMFEKTSEFKQAEESAQKTREAKVNGANSHSFYKLPGTSLVHNATSSKSITNSNGTNLKKEVQSSKKRSASSSPDEDDDDVVAIDPPSSSIVRPPVKKLPGTRPDFHSFAPKEQTIPERTKVILDRLRNRRAVGEQFPMTQIIAHEQLRMREQTMRTAKPPVVKPISPSKAVKRKANDIVESSAKKKKTQTVTKNAFDRFVQDITETMTHVTLTNTTTTSTTTVSSSALSSVSSIDSTVVQSSSVSSVLPILSSATTVKSKPNTPRKVHTYDDYILYILKWPATLLDELEPEPGFLYKNFLGENIYPVPLLELYSSFDEYEQITLPWLFEETFEDIKRGVKTNDHKAAGIEYEAVLFQVRLFKSGMIELKSQVLIKRAAAGSPRQEMFVDEDFVVVTLPNQSTAKVFGLVRSSERIFDRNRLHKSFADHPDVKARPPTWTCYEYNIRIFGNGMKINDGSKIKIQAITSLIGTLRRFKALASMRSCPLFEHLLSPSLTDSIFQVSNKRDNCLEEKYLKLYNESQRNVIAEAVSMICDTKEDDQAKIYMCQGPPGTGKSQTITGIVRAVLQQSSSSSPSSKKMKILICCPSNGGCNEIVRRLIDVFARKATDSTASSSSTSTTTNLPFKLIRCARGGGVSQDIENVSLDVLAQKRLEEVLNTGGQHEAIERNLANKEKQKQKLLQRIEDEKKKSLVKNSEELKDLEMNLKELQESIVKLQQTSRKTMPETARRQREREIKLELLQDADICVSTLNYAGNSIFDSFCPFDNVEPSANKVVSKSKTTLSSSSSKITAALFNCLIIDEAGQCLEIDNYIPLRLGMNRIVLVGDPEQLPATVLSRRALEAGLNQSLFERLYKLFKYDIQNPIRMLNIQYRMHDEICKFPSMHIYRSKLKTDKIIHQKRKKFLLKPYMVLDVVKGQEQLDPISQSYGNIFEADMVVSLVQFITEQGKVPFNQIGIITPYAYQVKLIDQRLAHRNFHQQKIEIGTVDAYQGRQKDVIILSCVRATQNPDSTTSIGIGFVANRQRLNVSLTRAKYAMYILGHMNSLNINDDWQKLYSNAVERKMIVQLTSPDQFDCLIKRQSELPPPPPSMETI